jgi:transcriptional regulator GlxA family with amidase domain
VHIQSSRSRRTAWPNATLDLLADELERREVGGEAVISRLCDILVLQTIRAWVGSDDAAGSPWLRAMNDRNIGPALAAMHADPAASWSVATLASVAMMSRSGFAARFTDMVGQPAMQYLTELRMQLAADHLRRGELSVSAVAHRVGYQSEASFARAFRREIGASPRSAKPARPSLSSIAG